MNETLSDRSALVVGAGGLGGPVLLSLGAAGVGRILFCDDDRVETSNLNRQPLFGEKDLGQPKAAVAVQRLGRLFPMLRVNAVDRRFDEGNAIELASKVDLLVDASDNFATKFLVNDVAVTLGRPLVHGGVLGFTAHVLTVVPGETGCLRCLFEGPPESGTEQTTTTAGILGALAGLAGSLMGAEAARILAGERGAYAGRLLVYEAERARSRFVAVRRRPGCSACGN